MNSSISKALSVLTLMAAASPAAASSSDWYTVEGGGIRLVTAGQADASGLIRGVLEIALKPGWKTYWRDPGDAGVPPTIDIAPSTNISAATLDYPPPQRFDDGFAVWAGYKDPVSLPITFAAGKPAEPALIEADVFLGICETICIPVQARLSVDPAADPENADDSAVVEAAFAALPEPARAEFGVIALKGEYKQLLVQANIPGGDPERAEFFIAGSDGYTFGTPERRIEGDKALFAIPILEWPAGIPGTGGLSYTLVTDVGAVAGVLPFH
ncbi:MAG TPA: protein-disulfide reductase DsbD domain-containing protein [Rhizobiaceae bacterium]|nr:protein-disulfide reductase DsbD domain-containing protein [Rhizobiaceae bacterium]